MNESFLASAWAPWWVRIISDAMHMPAISATPEQLDQPILPGWTFGTVVNVTNQNSSSPETEREILEQESYGRQLGRIIDALSDVIEDRSTRRTQAMDRFLELRDKIDRMKSKAAQRHCEQLKNHLAIMKRQNPGEYRQFVADLRRVLDASDTE
jgi:hypothetical protein